MCCVNGVGHCQVARSQLSRVANLPDAGFRSRAIFAHLVSDCAILGGFRTLSRPPGGLLAGRFRTVIELVNEGIAAQNGDISLADAAALAMAYHESGDHAKAVAMLAKLADDLLTGPASSFWDAEANRLLRLEVVRLILDRPFPVDAFAR